MPHLPYLPHQNRGDLFLGRLWRFPISPLLRVTAPARTAHLYVIGQLDEGKSKLLVVSPYSVDELPYANCRVPLKPDPWHCLPHRRCPCVRTSAPDPALLTGLG